MTTCTHLDQARQVEPRIPDGCEECLQTGDRWVHLRLCLTCGHVGCCDSSPNRHATAHHQGTGHPLIRSFEPGEDWAWCYPDALPLKASTIEAALETAREAREGGAAAERAYSYPEPDGFAEAQVPSGATYHPDLREFVLPWPANGGTKPNAENVLGSLRSSYSAAAASGGWDPSQLEPR